MAIWFDTFPIDVVREHSKNTLISQLGIEFLEASDEHLSARMPVDARTRQPAGMLHGGASVVLAETLLKASASTRSVRLKPSSKLLGSKRTFTVRVRIAATDASGNRRLVERSVKVTG